MNFIVEELLKKEKEGFYGFTQCNMCYHSNKLGKNTLTQEQIDAVFKTGMLPITQEPYLLKDIQEAGGHVLLFDEMLNSYEEPLSEELLKRYHMIFRSGILEERLNGISCGIFRENTEADMRELLNWYQRQSVSLETLAILCWKYIYLHPFEKGNEQILQMILFKECLKHELMPFVIESRYERDYGQILALEEQDGIEELRKFFESEQNVYSGILMKISGLRMEQPVPVSTFGLRSARQLPYGEYIHQSDTYFDKTAEPGFYNYCPSIFEKDGVIYTYFCTNTVPYEVVDSIAMIKSIPNPNGEGYLYTNPKIVLKAAIQKSWDSQHVCDPSVIEGSFVYDGKAYKYLLGYLGCTSLDNQDNQTGVAVSNDLETWHKLRENPFIHYEHDKAHPEFQWGVGQVSMLNLDKKGKVALFYTSGTYNLTSQKVRVMELSDLNKPVLLTEMTVPNEGTIQLNGYTDFISNADFAYRDGILYMVCDTHPYGLDIYENGRLIARNSSITPDRSSVYSMPLDLEKFNWSKWKRETYIDKERTGYDKNHNCGFVRDSYGYLKEGNMTVMYTGATGLIDGIAPFCRLWTYQICQYEILCHEI